MSERNEDGSRTFAWFVFWALVGCVFYVLMWYVERAMQ